MIEFLEPKLTPRKNMTSPLVLDKKITNKFNYLLSSLRIRIFRNLAPFLPPVGGNIYDIFLFNDEIDMLKLRFAELYDYVDFFIICECSVTFSGKQKPLYFFENRNLFLAYADKIRHYVIPVPPQDAYVTNPSNSNQLISEFWQRNQLSAAFKFARGHDLILISDVDELPKVSVLDRVYKICYWSNCVTFFRQNWYLLFLNARVVDREHYVFASNGPPRRSDKSTWIGTFASTALNLKRKHDYDLNAVWSKKWGSHSIVEPIVMDAGWHFSYMSGLRGLLTKCEALGNKEYTASTVDEIAAGRFIGNSLRIEDVGDQLPKVLQEHPHLWTHLMTYENSFSSLASSLTKHLNDRQ